jgi:hypothetical protein
MKSMNLTMCLLLAASIGMASSALHAQGTDPEIPAQSRMHDTGNAETAKADEADAVELDCIRHTGTRIKPRDGDPEACIDVPGRSYSRRDLERTGHLDLARALRLLDPAIR